MRPEAAALHFIQLASSWVAETTEGITLGEIEGERSIEDWTQDFQSYLAIALRGRRGIDPNHPVFKDEMISLLREMFDDTEGHTRDWRQQIEEVLGWELAKPLPQSSGYGIVKCSEAHIRRGRFRVGQKVILCNLEGRKYNPMIALDEGGEAEVVEKPNHDFPEDAVQIRYKNGEGAIDVSCLRAKE